MAEKKGDGANKEFDPEERFRYVGFEVQHGKIKDLFVSEDEKKNWVQKVLEKRSKFGTRLRGESSFAEPRVAGYEKIVLAVTSIILVVSLFLPWFSGYTEYEVEAEPVQKEETALIDSTLIDSTLVDSLADSLTLAGIDVTEAEPMAEEIAVTTNESLTEEAGADEEISIADETPESGSREGYEVLEKDAQGFASITSIQKRKEIKRERESYSAIGVIGRLGSVGGAVFSSGFVLMLTSFLFIVYILLCLGSAAYTIYLVYGVKDEPDAHALKLKRALKLNWIPILIWFFCLVLSFFGASYSFDSSSLMKQIGASYGVGTYLGLLGYGFYISIACFIMNAVKAVEI